MPNKINPDQFTPKQLDELLTTLETVDKHTHWISRDLKLKKRGWFGNLCWKMIFKRFEWTRKMYGINPEESKENLIFLKNRVKSCKDKALSKKYLLAINHFNAIFSHHTINLEEFDDITSNAKWNYFKHVQLEASKPNNQFTNKTLLVKAIKDNEPEAALWLIRKKKVPLEHALPALIPNEKLARIELITWLRAVTQKTEAKPENLDHFALDVGYGYKSANLMVLEKKTDEINKTLKTAIVKVPPFLAISDFEMRSYIFKALPEIEGEWNQFLNSFPPDIKTQYINRKANDQKIPPLKISPEGKAIIQEIQRKIIAHFTENCYLTPQIREWLEREKPELLIVRSTGKEDTENNSNAGGNDSIPFVKLNAQEISETMGRVLASYFGEKSVSQRLLAGDQSLFTQPKPFLPILLQVMVLESGIDSANKKDPLDIPRSGVLFTTQKDKAEGVTFIQTGLGNNEGVVSSQVAVDSYLVDRKGSVHAIVRDKKTRFVRVEKEGGRYEAAQINNNDSAMQRSQALPNGVVRDLKKVADAVSYHYSKEKGVPKPLDMEYTVKMREPKAHASKPVIYLLQARPLVSGDVKAKPSYLDLSKLDKIPDEDQLHATVLIDIRNDVRNVETTKQIIFADSLPKALETYTHSDDPQQIKTIVVRKSAPATSHESVVLRPKGVAVLVIENPKEYAQAEAMAKAATAERPLKIDTQHGVLVSTKNIPNHKTLEKLGLVSYPIPREVSIPQASMFSKINGAQNPKQREALMKSELQHAEERYQALVNDLLNGKSPLPFKKGQPNAMDIHRLLDVMATGNEIEAKRALGTLLKFLHARMHQNLKDAKGFQNQFQLPLFNAFQYALRLSEREIVPALYHTKPQSMERLYPIKFLEAVIFQQHGSDIVAADSFAASLHIHQEQNIGIARAKELKIDQNNPYAGQIVSMLEMGIKAAASQKASAQWQDFVMKLANSKDGPSIKKMHDLLRRMNELNLLSLGINIIFMDLYSKQKKSTSQVISAMESEMVKNKETLDWIEANLKLLPSEQQIAGWGDPNIAGKQLTTFKTQFLTTLGFGLKQPNNIPQRYTAATTLGKLALLEYMNKGVNIYDTIIKQVTGSTQYPADRKLQAKHFAELLEGYFEMMQTSLNVIPKLTEQSIMKINWGGWGGNNGYTFEKLVNKLVNGDSYVGVGGFISLVDQAKKQTAADTQKLFEARSQFSVAPLIIGSKIDMDFHVTWPSSLEEYFTVFHQNMEAVRNVMTNELGLNNSILSHQPETICAEFDKAFLKTSGDAVYNPKISYIAQHGAEVEVAYNIPLRQHAGSLGVTFNPQKPELGAKITVRMMGNHEHSRWHQAAMVGAWLGNLPPLSLENNIPPVINWSAQGEGATSVEFTLRVPQGYTKTKELMEMLSFCMQVMTLNFKSNEQVIAELEKVGPFKDVGTKFFNDTLYGNESGLGKLNDQKADAKLAEAIKLTVLSAVKNNYNWPHFEMQAMIAFIHEVVTRNPNVIKGVINELHVNADVQAKYPHLWNFLGEQKSKLLPPDQLYKESVEKKNWKAAIKIAEAQKNAAWKTNVIQKMKVMKKDEIMAFIITLDKDAKDVFMDNYLKSINADLHAEMVAKKVKEAQRAIHFVQFNTNLTKLQSKLGDFNANAEEIVELSKNALIGLSQAPDMHVNAPFGFQTYIQELVGNPSFNYVYDNVHTDTLKVRKGAPLCIIKAMSLKGNPAQVKAFQAVEFLIRDYLDMGAYNPTNTTQMKAVMYALSKAYFDNSTNKSVASANLKKWWDNSEPYMGELKTSLNLEFGLSSIAYNLPL